MSSLIKGAGGGVVWPELTSAMGRVLGGGPLVGAAAVRELTRPEPIVISRGNRTDAEFRAHGKAVAAGIEQPDSYALPTVADVENDGDRGPRGGCFHPGKTCKEALCWGRPSRDPLASIDAAADAQRAAHVGALLAAVAGLHVDEVRVLAAMARQLPGVRLRAACEAATAQGWVRSGARGVEVPSSPLARAQSSLLGTWREWIALILGARSPAAGEVAQRDRGDVLADELARRVAGEPGGEK